MHGCSFLHCRKFALIYGSFESYWTWMLTECGACTFSLTVSKLANGITMGTEASYMKPNLWSLFSLWVTVGTLK